MQAFQISTGPAPAPGPKNYVFVDEHNRHKRLKVMRACEGCRRRKIKCDAATTNTWPCGACRRLKLPCVPPAGGADGDQMGDQGEITSSNDHPIVTPQFVLQQGTFQSQYQPTTTDGENPPALVNLYDEHQPQQMYGEQIYTFDQQNLQSQLQAHVPLKEYRFHSVDSSSSQKSASSPKSPDQQTAEILTEQLGDLQIAETGVAGYIRQQETSNKVTAGPIQDSEFDLLPLSTAAGSQIRIPPALMPSNEDATESFALFFEHVHPYAPVLCRSQFYQAWNDDRDNISPLLLEAIFACAARVSGEPVGDSSWLALANKHEASFLDTPRLSTVQALILLLKAREGSPKRGYFYKSWMTCKTIVSMAKDLDLHEHLATHRAGDDCGHSPADCLAMTRVWQTLLVCEMMIGGPQGRSDLGVDPDSVEYGTNPPHSTMDDFEAALSRRYAFFVLNSRNIRLCLGAYIKVRKRKEWGLDPDFVVHNDKFKNWPNELPKDLQITMPPNHSPPSIMSHFIGNMHVHYQLGIIIMHRPQLLAVKSFADDQQWQHHLMICYNAAKKLCRLQEAIVAQHDVLGLLCMQRGMSFTVYAILTCIMLHMIAITSPDPEFNANAREYFVRHMQLLERCIPEWPMLETELQIQNLRAAFSADLEKPFVLKPSFPYGTPDEYSPAIRKDSEQPSTYSGSIDQAGYIQNHWQQHDGTHFPTPPLTISTESTLSHSTPSIYQDFNLTPTQPQYSQLAPTSYPSSNLAQTQPWNPAPIIEQFNTAFAIPPSALAPPQSTTYGTSPPIIVSHSQQYAPSPQTPNYDHNMYSLHHGQINQAQHPPQIPQQHQIQHNQTHYFDPNLHGSQPSISHSMSQASYTPDNSINTSTQQYNAANIRPQPHNPGMVYVTPKQWQQSVASVYDPSGLKRKWHFGNSG